ncbi:4-hydroxythreonine-4-phosphate dehydrogenase PdxA [Candidatus Endomicrobiellum trichonymphae]|uniref:4-hydroxythreonine-4-phosphate dehydrogenase PdxA n=1 Tax=Endomicrobium trichonymphae TaxID=1408204 RepID=UPI00086542D5|nr:4-hydroxythreonine-4-phosphate dehydrogenase PdxA [Candidatus Endomicrobium trichonymphae]BAV58713.1 4-hydroxythreonine-4-phosphate dehydrogenase [Candidatus Endomicrobium trichonymphae]
MTKPRLAITLGDPAGVGCEIVCRAVSSSAVKRVCNPVIFGDKQSLKRSLLKYLKNRMPFEFVESSNIGDSVKMGAPSKKAGIIAASAIYKAVKYCANGKALALVTAPVSKESLKMSGIKYPGHTELLASLTNSKKVAMMMTCGNIHGVMVTRHIPVSKISENIKTKTIVEAVNLSVNFLRKAGKKNIKVVLCGLNPHAGDNSILGFEEKKFILPAYKIIKKSGIDITKPLSADSAWLKTKNGQYDLICAMYHDQIMIALKCINAAKIVNVTIGLPFVRTSPGHGTAFNIAGKNEADASAMIEAVLYAARWGKKSRMQS